MPKISVSEFASNAVESIRKKQMKSVIADLDKLSKKEAMAAVAYIVDYLRGNDNYQYNVFLRTLSDRL